MKAVLVAVLGVCAVAQPAFARPVSYPGGWTAMTMNDVDSNEFHAHYTINPSVAVGVGHEYMRESGVNVDTARLNWLVKRWNNPGSQANLYVQSGAGVAYDDGEYEPAAFTGLAIDWEDRRYFTSYENKFFKAGDDLESSAKHKARVGITPYIGEAGELHTWLMLQADYDAGAEDSFSLTPLVRLFKGSMLVEAGYNLDGGVLFNFTHNF